LIEWQGKKHFTVDGIKFRVVTWFDDEGLESSADVLAVFKHPWMIERYVRLFDDLKPNAIFELGIQRGGSCVFFQRLAATAKLVAIEIAEQRVAAVDDYIAMHRLADKLKLYYGIDQADTRKLRAIAAQEFDDGIDLVIDDASHLIDETRASFNALFPLLRPGGIYVIEDWPWAHARTDCPDDAPGLHVEREPLTKLLFEITMACPSSPNLIDEIVIDRNSVAIRRGSAEIDAQYFDIQRCTLARGRNLIA
jgi:hypothetical protein